MEPTKTTAKPTVIGVTAQQMQFNLWQICGVVSRAASSGPTYVICDVGGSKLNSLIADLVTEHHRGKDWSCMWPAIQLEVQRICNAIVCTPNTKELLSTQVQKLLMTAFMAMRENENFQPVKQMPCDLACLFFGTIGLCTVNQVNGLFNVGLSWTMNDTICDGLKPIEPASDTSVAPDGKREIVLIPVCEAHEVDMAHGVLLLATALQANAKVIDGRLFLRESNNAEGKHIPSMSTAQARRLRHALPIPSLSVLARINATKLALTYGIGDYRTTTIFPQSHEMPAGVIAVTMTEGLMLEAPCNGPAMGIETLSRAHMVGEEAGLRMVWAETNTSMARLCLQKHIMPPGEAKDDLSSEAKTTIGGAECSTQKACIIRLVGTGLNTPDWIVELYDLLSNATSLPSEKADEESGLALDDEEKGEEENAFTLLATNFGQDGVEALVIVPADQGTQAITRLAQELFPKKD